MFGKGRAFKRTLFIINWGWLFTYFLIFFPLGFIHFISLRSSVNSPLIVLTAIGLLLIERNSLFSKRNFAKVVRPAVGGTSKYPFRYISRKVFSKISRCIFIPIIGVPGLAPLFFLTLWPIVELLILFGSLSFFLSYWSLFLFSFHSCFYTLL